MGKDDTTYDANGNMTVGIDSHWNDSTSQWENVSKTEYTYDANSNLTVDISSNWNSSTSQWENSYKEESTYDANGNMTVKISSHWNSSTSQWENLNKEEDTYDANGNRTVKIGSYWISSTSQWENSNKEESTYDANGNRTVDINSYWNSSTSQWENSDKEEDTYDLAYLTNDLILPDFYYDLSVNKIIGDTIYGYDGTTWVNSFAGTYYYSDITTSVSEVHSNAYTVYPNPASKYVTFNISEPTINSKVDIFTVQGEKILTQSLKNKTVDVSAFPKGIYIYQLNINGKITNGKIVIK